MTKRESPEAKHDAGCWRVHLNCAVARVKRLESLILELNVEELNAGMSNQSGVLKAEDFGFVIDGLDAIAEEQDRIEKERRKP